MPEFLTLLPPDSAREKWFARLSDWIPSKERIATSDALHRVAAEALHAPHALPQFPRSAVDGYAVRAADTYGASAALPAYLALIGECPMGDAPSFSLRPGDAALIHTGGMLPEGADAVVMLEYTQRVRDDEVEIQRAAAVNENVIQIGEDIQKGAQILPAGTRLRPAEIGALMAMGITSLHVWTKPRIGLMSTGDEILPPERTPAPGQVRDINSYTLAALIEETGGEPIRYGIFPDDYETLRRAAADALAECDALILTAGSSASARDMTAQVINELGAPGALVHGINTRPGKPTILGVCDGKAVVGLPGNPVSALVNGYMLIVPLVEKLLGLPPKRIQPALRARLTVNLPSQAGREDWVPVRLLPSGEDSPAYLAEPIFGKSNLIFTLAAADGLLKIPPDATGMSAGEIVHIRLV